MTEYPPTTPVYAWPLLEGDQPNDWRDIDEALVAVEQTVAAVEALATAPEAVTSVNGETGAVVLDAADVGALTQAAADLRYEPLDSAYTKAESDAKYALTGHTHPSEESGPWRFQDTAGGAPGAGYLRTNSGALIGATQLIISRSTQDGYDIPPPGWGVVAGDTIYVQDRDDSTKWVRYVALEPLVRFATYATGLVTMTGHAGAVIVNGQIIQVTFSLAGGGGGGAGGVVGTDPVWDAKGDLVAGTGADAAARLPVGTTGQVLTADSAQTLGVKWASPLSAHDHTAADGSGVLTNDAHDGYSQYANLGADPTTPTANTIRLYSRDNGSGVSTLFYRSEDGSIYEIPTLGTGGGNGSGAPSNASYITTTAENKLSQEKVLGTAVIMSGTLASRPASGTAGRLYLGTDTNTVYRDTGSVWETFATRSTLAGDALADAKGDLFAASAADTIGRLPVGTDGQLLTADSTQTLGVKWATLSTGAVGASATHSASQSIANATWTRLALDSETDDTDAMHFTSSANLTGTVSKTASGTTLTGSGTAFTTELSVGQVVSVPGTTTELKVITAIGSATSATVASAWSATASGQTAARVNGALVVRTAGRYLIGATVAFASNSSNERIIGIGRNQSDPGNPNLVWERDFTNTVPQDKVMSAGPVYVNCAQWDFLTLSVYQPSNGALNVLGQNTGTHYGPYLWAVLEQSGAGGGGGGGGSLATDPLADAKGDVFAASAADTVGRLAVGTDGQVLTADSAQTLGVKWATPTAGGLDQATADGRYVNVTGDVLTGALTAPSLSVATLAAETGRLHGAGTTGFAPILNSSGIEYEWGSRFTVSAACRLAEVRWYRVSTSQPKPTAYRLWKASATGSPIWSLAATGITDSGAVGWQVTSLAPGTGTLLATGETYTISYGHPGSPGYTRQNSFTPVSSGVVTFVTNHYNSPSGAYPNSSPDAYPGIDAAVGPVGNPVAAAGAVRLANAAAAGAVAWRNAADTADLSLTMDASDRLALAVGSGSLASSATAGAASALPGAPSTYLTVVVNGTAYKLAAWAV